MRRVCFLQLASPAAALLSRIQKTRFSSSSSPQQPRRCLLIVRCRAFHKTTDRRVLLVEVRVNLRSDNIKSIIQPPFMKCRIPVDIQSIFIGSQPETEHSFKVFASAEENPVHYRSYVFCGSMDHRRVDGGAVGSYDSINIQHPRSPHPKSVARITGLLL